MSIIIKTRLGYYAGRTPTRTFYAERDCAKRFETRGKAVDDLCKGPHVGPVPSVDMFEDVDDDVLTVRDVISLSAIIASNGKRVRWLADNRRDTPDGVNRGIVADLSGNYPGPNDDIRDANVLISSTFEHFIPVRRAMWLQRNGGFGVDE